MASNFPFVRNKTLRTNLDEAFDHVVTLLPFTESSTYNPTAKSAFRKTIIIHTAAIVEALLFHVLDKKLSKSDVAECFSAWKLQNKKELYAVSVEHKIVAGDYKKVRGDGRKEKLNLGQIINILKDKKILSKDLHKKIEKLKDLRNEQHIGAQTKVKEYTKKDMETAFDVARRVKEFARKSS